MRMLEWKQSELDLKLQRQTTINLKMQHIAENKEQENQNSAEMIRILKV